MFIIAGLSNCACASSASSGMEIATAALRRHTDFVTCFLLLTAGVSGAASPLRAFRNSATSDERCNREAVQTRKVMVSATTLRAPWYRNATPDRQERWWPQPILAQAADSPRHARSGVVAAPHPGADQRRDLV